MSPFTDRSWQVSPSFHRLMKSPPFHIPEAWKRYPFRAEPPRKGHNGSTPRGHEDTCFFELLYSVDVLYIFAKCNNRPYSRYSSSLHAVKVWWDKSDVTWLLRGQTSDKFFQYKKSRAVEFVYSWQQKMNNFLYWRQNDNLWVEVIIATFLNAVATVDVLIAMTLILSKLKPYILHDC